MGLNISVQKAAWYHDKLTKQQVCPYNLRPPQPWIFDQDYSAKQGFLLVEEASVRVQLVNLIRVEPLLQDKVSLSCLADQHCSPQCSQLGKITAVSCCPRHLNSIFWYSERQPAGTGFQLDCSIPCSISQLWYATKRNGKKLYCFQAFGTNNLSGNISHLALEFLFNKPQLSGSALHIALFLSFSLTLSHSLWLSLFPSLSFSLSHYIFCQLAK